MKLHGSVEDNLSAAIRSARRLRGRAIHADTLRYWSELLEHARRERIWTASQLSNRRGKLVLELEGEIAQRTI